MTCLVTLIRSPKAASDINGWFFKYTSCVFHLLSGASDTYSNLAGCGGQGSGGGGGGGGGAPAPPFGGLGGSKAVNAGIIIKSGVISNSIWHPSLDHT